MELAGKTALITGAGRRLGRAMAVALAQEGVALAIHHLHSESDAQSLVSEIETAGGRATALRHDLTEVEGAASVVDAAEAALGPVAILINNASFFSPAGLEETDAARLRKELAVHVEAPYVLSRRLAARLPMKEQGRIVNLLDWRAELPDARYLGYSVAKGALRAATRNLAIALGPRITVNGIAPGAILPPEAPAESAPSGTDSPQLDPSLFEGLPAARAGTVADITKACLFLLKDADYITGAVLPVDGGRHLL